MVASMANSDLLFETFWNFFPNIFLNVLFILVIFGCAESSLLRASFLLVAASGGCSLLRCAAFSLQWLLLLWSTGSRHVGFHSCGSWAQLLRGMWDLPGPGLKPVAPALAGGFLTTVPPGKPFPNTFDSWFVEPWMWIPRRRRAGCKYTHKIRYCLERYSINDSYGYQS